MSTTLTLAALKAQLGEFRDIIESGWSAQTIHPDYEFVRMSPVGQCGPSSAWIVLELAQRYGIEAEFCCGEVVSTGDAAKSLPDHCWVEVDDLEAPGHYIIDITCDQIEYFRAQRFLLAGQDELRSDDIDYVAQWRTPAAQLPQVEVWPRYEILDRAIAAKLRSAQGG
ncbi:MULTISPECIES: hypothetical protein [unclassified Kribbella]|uniref:hypothetical protein n=1 Tax=unclassified Kribbella TaxID=2644121 RepID=UPI003017955E